MPAKISKHAKSTRIKEQVSSSQVQVNSRPIPKVEDQINLYSITAQPIYPNIRQTMVNYNLRNQSIPVLYQQPQPQYCQVSYVPNIIHPYPNLQPVRHPSNIYYYYPI